MEVYVYQVAMTQIASHAQPLQPYVSPVPLFTMLQMVLVHTTLPVPMLTV